jgi:hypothetical protein
LLIEGVLRQMPWKTTTTFEQEQPNKEPTRTGHKLYESPCHATLEIENHEQQNWKASPSFFL